MFEPIVFISHFKIKDGKFDDLEQLHQQVTEQIKTNKPGTVAFLQYLNEDKTELSIIHVFPDTESFDLHVEGVDERAKAGFELVEPTSREVYGMPSERVMEMLRPADGTGITFKIMPQPMGGYIRLMQA
jgi:quinol monooxygenase YgiN